MHQLKLEKPAASKCVPSQWRSNCCEYILPLSRHRGHKHMSTHNILHVSLHTKDALIFHPLPVLWWVCTSLLKPGGFSRVRHPFPGREPFLKGSQVTTNGLIDGWNIIYHPFVSQKLIRNQILCWQVAKKKFPLAFFYPLLIMHKCWQPINKCSWVSRFLMSL